jgi:3-phenylpropionate/trans-cinnamate dioxygenase ferredoxin reductase subunit
LPSASSPPGLPGQTQDAPATPNDGVVIVGGGQAGFQVAASLRAEGYQGSIRLVAAEVHPPYQRPPLSKALLLGKMDKSRLLFRQPAFYEAQGIELLLGERVAAVDPAARRVRTAGGRTLAYDALVLATGTRVRPLPVAGTELDGVVYLRTIEESEALARRIAAAERVVVIGGGFIGLEVAAAARMLGKPVTVLEAADRPMGRVVAPVISRFFAELHRERGVELVMDARIARLEGEAGRVRAVVMEDGGRHPADLVVIGIGVLPNVELAQEAGLACADGIVVDEHGRTSDPHIWAAGECTSHPNRFAGGRARLESVQNAVDQAKAVAAAILGRHQPYDEVPWFWSDQYEIKLQMVGISRGHDRQVVRGDPASGRFSVFYFEDGRLIAIDSVNRPSDHMAGRRLLAAGTSLTPEQAADEAFDLKAAAQR